MSTETNATSADEVRTAAIAAGVSEHDTYSMRLFATAFAAGRCAAAADIERMPLSLGDEGWGAIAKQAVNAGYDRRLVTDRRRRDDFTTSTIEVAYQYGYRQAAKVAKSGRAR